jgi:hypothetical protein
MIPMCSNLLGLEIAVREAPLVHVSHCLQDLPRESQRKRGKERETERERVCVCVREEESERQIDR